MLLALKYTGSVQAAHKDSPSMKTNSCLREDRQPPSGTSCPLTEADELGQQGIWHCF